MLSKSVQLEQDLYRAIDGFIIARVEEILGSDDPGISLTTARNALQKQLRILCNEACSYKPAPVFGPIGVDPIHTHYGPIVAQSSSVVIEENFHMKDLFAKAVDLGIPEC
jgi:hypothetical protein